MTKNLVDIGVKVLLGTGVILLAILYWEGRSAIAYVDAQKLMIGYKGMQAARKEFETKITPWKSNLDTLQREIEGKMKEYESKKAKLSSGEKKLMEELIKSKQEQYVNYQGVIQEKIQKEDQELTSNVLNKVNDYIKKYGQKNGYEIIFAATQYGNIIYAKEGRDITDDVLKGLNTEFN
jgi:outer membrane protein